MHEHPLRNPRHFVVETVSYGGAIISAVCKGGGGGAGMASDMVGLQMGTIDASRL